MNLFPSLNASSPLRSTFPFMYFVRKSDVGGFQLYTCSETKVFYDTEYFLPSDGKPFLCDLSYGDICRMSFYSNTLKLNG
jgi:hypothetical protein